MKKQLLTASLIAASFVAGRTTQQTTVQSIELEPQLIIPAIVTDVHDGDTLTVEVKNKIQVRMLENYAIELSDEKGIEARNALAKKCPVGSEVIVKIPYKTDIWRMFTFGRILGYIYKDGEDLSDFIVKSGYATKTKVK